MKAFIRDVFLPAVAVSLIQMLVFIPVLVCSTLALAYAGHLNYLTGAWAGALSAYITSAAWECVVQWAKNRERKRAELNSRHEAWSIHGGGRW